MEARRYYVYILSNTRNTVLYTGVTGDLENRVYEHKDKSIKGFIKQYNVDTLVYYEEFDNPRDAILREKQIKAGSREKKEKLVRERNPEWKDLSREWYVDKNVSGTKTGLLRSLPARQAGARNDSKRVNVWIFGNPDLPQDALPVALIPELQRRFPDAHFQRMDPLEEWEVPKDLIIVDTVQGLEKVRVFTDLDAFESAPRLTMHDYDLGTTLKWMKKIGRLADVTIIGVPMGMDRQTAVDQVAAILSER